MFWYTHASQDLVAGDFLQVDLDETTYGRGKTVEICPATDDQPFVVGCAKAALDASVSTDKWIEVATRGVVSNAQAHTDVAALSPIVSGGGNAGECRAMAAGEEHNVVGVAYEADGATTAGEAEVWLFGKYIMDSPA